jgi:hypothetical protein
MLIDICVTDLLSLKLSYFGISILHKVSTSLIPHAISPIALVRTTAWLDRDPVINQNNALSLYSLPHPSPQTLPFISHSSLKATALHSSLFYFFPVLSSFHISSCLSYLSTPCVLSWLLTSSRAAS